MSQRWRYVEQGPNDSAVFHTYTEDEIIRVYYPYWCGEMCKVDKFDQISRQACIDDWVVVNWAEQVKS